MSESQFNYTVIEQMHKSPIWDNHILKVRVRGKDKIYVLKLYGGINEPFQKLVFNREMEALKVLNSCSNIVKIRDTTASLKYNGKSNYGAILMDYLDGKTLDLYDWHSFTQLKKYEICLKILQAVYNAAKAAGTPDAAQQQIIDLCDQFYARIAVAATAQEKTVGADFASITIAELDGLKSGGEYSKPKAGETVGVEYFQKGVCYYNILIRYDDEITAWMAHGKYGVVRNNWYTLTINSVKQPGTPWLPDKTDPTDPENPGEDDDDQEAYLSVNITVNPWTTWSQGVDL